jgi:hypothetical protein
MTGFCEEALMKWVWSSAIVVFTVSVAVSAQSSEPKMADTMSKAYTGCLETVNHGGSFLLTHVSSGTAMHDDGMMKKEARHVWENACKASHPSN